MTKNKLALAVAAGAFTTTVIGGVAVAGFQPFGPGETGESALPQPAAALAERDKPKDTLKATLDALVAKGTINQAQEDAILQAVKDAAPKPATKPSGPSTKSFVGDLMKATTDYLGIDAKTLLGELRNRKSIAEVANGLSAQGKSAKGLTDTLVNAANAKVDQAVAANKLTADQAATLKPKIATEIGSFVDRSFKHVAPLPKTPVKPTPTPKS
ncbi:MAG TPA: hypothetical protein VGA38_13420 [Candidatus Limnocylindria bacterium]